jgi:hypothetical protein
VALRLPGEARTAAWNWSWNRWAACPARAWFVCAGKVTPGAAGSWRRGNGRPARGARVPACGGWTRAGRPANESGDGPCKGDGCQAWAGIDAWGCGGTHALADPLTYGVMGFIVATAAYGSDWSPGLRLPRRVREPVTRAAKGARTAGSVAAAVSKGRCPALSCVHGRPQPARAPRRLRPARGWASSRACHALAQGRAARGMVAPARRSGAAGLRRRAARHQWPHPDADCDPLAQRHAHRAGRRIDPVQAGAVDRLVCVGRGGVFLRHRPANDGALRPACPASTTHVQPSAAAPGTVAAAQAIPPQTPRQASGSRAVMALYRCMQRQCERPALVAHPKCVEWRRIEEGGCPGVDRRRLKDTPAYPSFRFPLRLRPCSDCR